MTLKIDQIGIQEGYSGRIVRFSLLVRPEDQEVFILRGRLAAVFEVDTTGSKAEKGSLRKIAEDIFLQNYFTKSFVSNEGSIKDSLRQIEEHFENLEIKSVSYSVAVVLADLAYLARKGECSVAYFRGGQLLEIKGITGDTSRLQFFSGKVVGGDVVGLVSGTMKKDNSLQEFLKQMQSLDPTKNVALFLYVQEESLVIKHGGVSKLPEKKGIKAYLNSRLDSWEQKRSQGVYIRSDSKKVIHQSIKRTQKIIILLLGVLLIGSSIYTIYKTRLNKRAELLGSVLGESSQKMAEAEDLIGLNNEKARLIIEELEKNINSSKALAEGDQVSFVNQTLSQLQALRDRANNVSRIKEEDIYYDLSLKKPGSVAAAICGVGSTIYLSDTVGKIWSISLEDTKLSAEIFDSKSYPTLQNLVCAEESVYIASADFVDKLATDKADFTLENNILRENKEFKGFTDFKEYLGNLYFINSGSNSILKYSETNGNFNEPINYLLENQSLHNGYLIAINGSVYAAGESSVGMYLSGEKQEWEVKNLPGSNIKYSKMYLGGTPESLYLLNQATNEIWYFNKEGFYQGLFTFEKPITDFYVSADSIYILSGSGIYKRAL